MKTIDMAQFIPIANRKRKFKGRTRWREATCPVCGAKRRDIRWHYKIYHPEWFESVFVTPLMAGEFGELSGVRFYEKQV